MQSNHAGRVSACALLFFLLVSMSSQAARADESEIKAAVEAHHAALHALQLQAVAALWSHSSAVTLVNPRDTSIAVGWDAVKNRWEHVFDIVTALDVTEAGGPHTGISGDSAWSIGVAHVVEQLKTEGRKEFDLLEVDVFSKHDGHWLITSHTARPL